MRTFYPNSRPNFSISAPASEAKTTAEIAHTESAPAAMTSGALASVIPPMATEIIRAQRRAFQSFFQRVHGEADDLSAAQQLARFGKRQIVLADVHAVGIHGERDIETVVDQKRHAPAQLAQLRRFLEQRAGFSHLPPVLHRRRARGDGGFHVAFIAGAAKLRIGDEIIAPHTSISCRFSTMRRLSPYRQSNKALLNESGP